MKPSMRTSLLTALLAVAVALPAVALANKDDSPRGSKHEGAGSNRGSGKGHGVPEFDPTAVGAIAAVIAGGGIVLARRRKS